MEQHSAAKCTPRTIVLQKLRNKIYNYKKLKNYRTNGHANHLSHLRKRIEQVSGNKYENEANRTKHELGARSSDALADDRTKLQTAPGHLKAAGRLQQATATTSTAAASRVKVLNFLTFFLTGTLL